MFVIHYHLSFLLFKHAARFDPSFFCLGQRTVSASRTINLTFISTSSSPPEKFEVVFLYNLGENELFYCVNNLPFKLNCKWGTDSPFLSRSGTKTSYKNYILCIPNICRIRSLNVRMSRSTFPFSLKLCLEQNFLNFSC